MLLKVFSLLTISFTSIFSFHIKAQDSEVSGKITDANTNKPLEYVTVQVADSNYGTTGELDGTYFIRLKNGPAKLIFSHIGYKTDTSYIYIEDSNIERNIFLKPSEIETDEIVVYGEDPAYEIIRKAIKYKKEFKKELNEYEYDAFSKFVIRSNQSDIKIKDSTNNSGLNIFGILESETKGYFRKPDEEKQIVTAKKETANVTRGFAIPLIVNFYDEDIDLNEFKIPTPLADDAFDNYDFRLFGTTSIDSTIIYKIEVINRSDNVPALYGNIYIADSIFSLRKINLQTNNAGNPRGFEKVIFNQRFASYRDTKDKEKIFWMPSDVHIFAKGSFVGLIKFEADVSTIVSDYQLNKKAPAGIFNDIIVKVLPDAKKDSAYWAANGLIKNTNEEKSAYKKIEIEDKKKDKEISIGLGRISYGRYLYSEPVNYYHYNKVEGSALLFNALYRGPLNRVNASGYFSYGTSDKKSKYVLNYRQRFFNDKRMSVSATFYDKIQPLSYPDFFHISIFVNTVKALFLKEDKLDYFYTTGYDLGLNYNFIPQLGLRLNYNQQKQRTAYNNTNYSFFNTDNTFIPNPEINDAFQRSVGISLRVSPNKYRGVDWGNGDISRFRVTNFPELLLGFGYSGKDVLNSNFYNRKFSVALNGNNFFNNFLNFRYKMVFESVSGQLPFQSLLFFNANTGTLDAPLTFTTVKYQEFLGDKIFYLNFENNFGKLFWGNIPIIKSLDLIGLFNMGRTQISDENFQYSASKNFSVPNDIFMEAGFGISRIFDIFRLDFAWRLNNFEPGSKIYTNFILEIF